MTSFFSRRNRKGTPDANAAPREPPKLVKTNYSSNEVNIPFNFLKTAPWDAQPITVEKINFAESTLPEYSGYYATVIENVLSKSECNELLRLAELSSPTGGWAPALVNAGGGYEVLATDYRNCDRIIWDNTEIVKRIWDRCIMAEGVKQELETIDSQVGILGPKAVKRGDKWKMTTINNRMRFLKYGPGCYFKSHCDGCYETPSKDQRSHYTIQLYLNDSEEVEGGATTFHSLDMSRRLDVAPKPGRVLIFQHAHLLHSGDEVKEGLKYTMRSDLMYKRVQDNNMDTDKI